MTLQNASLLGLFFLFILACIWISEWAHQRERAEGFKPRLVRTIMIDTETELEKQRGWE